MKTKRYPNAAAARRAIREKAQTEGAEIAYNAALDLCRDKNAPAQARAAAIATVIRIAGLFDKAPDDDLAEKPGYEMTAAELSESIAQGRDLIRRRMEAMERARAARGETGPLTDEDFDIAAAAADPDLDLDEDEDDGSAFD